MTEHRTTTTIDHIPAGTTGPPLPDGVWRVDPQRSEIGFAVKEMWGLRTVRGVFGAYEGSLEVRGNAAAGELTIEAASLDTGHDRRDQHLRSPAFFDVERYPHLVFAATAVTARERRVTVMGELLIGASRVRVEVPVDIEQGADGELRLQGRTAVSRAAAGLAWNKLGMIRGDAELHAGLTLTRASSS
jgi:polyisoprenoid-binding protein YceI